MTYTKNAAGLYYETNYGHNLQIFVIS